jgi:hypothetical protein
VPRPMAMQHATSLFELSNELAALHI